MPKLVGVIFYSVFLLWSQSSILAERVMLTLLCWVCGSTEWGSWPTRNWVALWSFLLEYNLENQMWKMRVRSTLLAQVGIAFGPKSKGSSSSLPQTAFSAVYLKSTLFIHLPKVFGSIGTAATHISLEKEGFLVHHWKKRASWWALLSSPHVGPFFGPIPKSTLDNYFARKSICKCYT